MVVVDQDFETWWQKYPRKVAKFAAQKAYRKARRMASVQELIDGIDRYVAHKPAYADFCHAATWLNSGRWLDEHDACVTSAVPLYTERQCPHEPRCENPGAWACVRKTQIDELKKSEAV